MLLLMEPTQTCCPTSSKHDWMRRKRRKKKGGRERREGGRGGRGGRKGGREVGGEEGKGRVGTAVGGKKSVLCYQRLLKASSENSSNVPI